MGDTTTAVVDEARVLRHLEGCEREYAAIGSAGYFALSIVIRPLRDRWNKGERSPELFAEIMDVKL